MEAGTWSGARGERRSDAGGENYLRASFPDAFLLISGWFSTPASK